MREIVKDRVCTRRQSVVPDGSLALAVVRAHSSWLALRQRSSVEWRVHRDPYFL